jgi:hypothetical protein
MIDFEAIKKRVAYNAHNLGEFGNMIRVEYVNNILDDVTRDRSSSHPTMNLIIGVIASDKTRAQHLITELHIHNAMVLTNNTSSTRGATFDAIIFDETACPPKPEVLDAITPAVPNGRIYQLKRIMKP